MNAPNLAGVDSTGQSMPKISGNLVSSADKS